MALSSFSVSAKGLDGIPYRVDVNGGGTAVTGDGQFLVIEGGEEQDRGLDPIWPKRLRLFMREDVDLSPLFGEADRAVDVAVQNVTGGTDTLVYRGFMVTDFYSDAPFEPKPLIELQALDGLGTLENDSLSAIYSGGTEASVNSGITSILSTLYPLEVEVGTEWYPDAGGALGTSDNPLQNVQFATDNYRADRPDGDAFQSQLAVLRDLCIEQGLVVKQVERPSGARWLVAQRSAYNSDGTLKVWTYDTTGSLKSGEPSTRDRSLTLDVNGQDLLREHTREFVRRRQAVEVTHDHMPLDDFVGDGGFEDAGDGNTTPWSIGSTSKLSAQVVSHDGPDNTPSASQQNTYLLEISGSPDGGNNFPQDSFEFPVSQGLGEVTGAQPRTAGRIKQSFEGNRTVLTPKDEDGIGIRISIGSYWLGVRSSSLTTDVKRGTGSLYCDPLDRPIPEGAALPVIKPNPPEDQPGNEFRGTITLSERAESGDTELVGDLSADFNTPMKVLYPSIESSQSVFPIQRFVDNPRTYPRFEIVFPFEDPNGNPLEGEVTYEAGGIGLITEENTQSGTTYSSDSVYLDDVEFALTRGGQDITQTVVEASVAELGEEEAQTARTFSGPTDQNLGRLRGNGFKATGWGIGVGGGSLSLAELKARERLRYWRNHNEMFSVTGVDRDGTTQLTGDELVTLDGQTYTVHSIKYDAAKGETELTLIEYEDRGTSGITLGTVLEQSDGTTGGTSSGGGGGAVGGGGSVSDWDALTGDLSGPVPFDATDDDGKPTSRSLQFLNVTPQVDVTSDPANGVALEIKDQTNGNRLGTLTTDGRWETRADQEAFADGSFGSGSSTNSLLQVEDAGTVLTTDAASLNFTGSGLSLTQNGDEITVDVSGGSGSDIDIEDNQTVVVGGATGLSFEGSGIDSVDNDGDGTARVNISKGSSTEVQEGGTAQVSDVTTLDFVGGDFSVANPNSGEAEVSLQNDTVTVAGNSVPLGGSTSLGWDDLDNMPVRNAGDYVSSTSTGGEAIQAAIDDLPSRGGRVMIPAQGPDTATNGKGNTESDVWAVGAPLSTGSKNGVIIEGESHGWRNPTSGTALIATSSISHVLELSSGFLDGVRSLRVDGGNQATNGVQCGSGNFNNDFQILNTMIHDCTNAVQLNCGSNVWLHQCWLEACTRGVDFDTFVRWFWGSELLFFDNTVDFSVGSIESGFWVSNSRATLTGNESISFQGSCYNISVENYMGREVGESLIKVTSGSTVEHADIDGIFAEGNSTTSHLIDNQGTLQDSSISDLHPSGLAGATLVNVVGDTTNAPRTTINGLGYNGANDPRGAGVWNGNGKEGVRVKWMDGGTDEQIATYVDGAWEPAWASLLEVEQTVQEQWTFADGLEFSNSDAIAFDQPRGNVFFKSDLGGQQRWIIQKNDGTNLFDFYNTGDFTVNEGQVGIGTTPSYALEVSGDARATGEVEAFLGSDRRLKTGLDPINSALDKVEQLTGYGFDWREGEAVQPHKRGETDVGLIAQEVEGVLPEAVREFQDGHSEGYKSVSYDKLVPLLIEAIKDLRSQIEQVQ